MTSPDRSRAPRGAAHRNDISAARTFAAVLGAAIAFALVFAGVDFLLGKAVAARFPAPAQAAVWSTIALFAAGTVALAVAAQVWWMLRRAR